MPIEQLNSFTQILTSLNFQQGEPPFKENAQNAELLPKPEDSIELSVQAKKALDAQQQSAGQANQAEVDAARSIVQIDAQGNRVQISPQGTELASSQASKVAWEISSSIGEEASTVETPKNVVGTATLDSGTKVSIYTADFAEGEKKPSFGAPDKKVMAEITRVDGSPETLAIRANTVISEDADGNLLVNSGNIVELNGTDKNDVIINIEGVDIIQSGFGNDTIINLNYANKIDIGNGNNMVICDAIAKEIYSGDGNNSILINQGTSRILLGDGNNNIILNGNHGQHEIVLGDGDNIIDANNEYNTVKKISAGNGNNQIFIDSFIAGSLDIGDGNNIVTICNDLDNNKLTEDGTAYIEYINNPIFKHEYYMDLTSAKFNFGNGNNILNAGMLYGDINIGDGNNKLFAQRTQYQGNLIIGNGDNTLAIDSITHMDISVGNGNNEITSSSLYISELICGNGHNSVNIDKAYRSKLNMGEGTNTLAFIDMSDCYISDRNGNNYITVDGNLWDSSFILGNGNNIIEIKGNVTGLNCAFGDGQNNLTVEGFISDSKISQDSGNLKLMLKSFVYNTTFNLGEMLISNIEEFGNNINNDSDLENIIKDFQQEKSNILLKG